MQFSDPRSRGAGLVGDSPAVAVGGTGKAREVPEAIRKATEGAKRNMVRIPLRDGRTLHHDNKGNYGAGKVLLRAAPAGTGIIAGGPMRAVFEVLGIQDSPHFVVVPVRDIDVCEEAWYTLGIVLIPIHALQQWMRVAFPSGTVAAFVRGLRFAT